MNDFTNTNTKIVETKFNKLMYFIDGLFKNDEKSPFCSNCNKRLHVNDKYEVNLRHLSIGNKFSNIRFTKERYRCPSCVYTKMENIPFKASRHRITLELYQYTRNLLAYGFTNKEISEITGLGKNTVKDIDLERLKEKYIIDGTKLIKPEK